MKEKKTRAVSPKSLANLSKQTSERARQGAKDRNQKISNALRYVEELRIREIVEHESFVQLLQLQRQQERRINALTVEYKRLIEERLELMRRLEAVEKEIERLKYFQNEPLTRE